MKAGEHDAVPDLPDDAEAPPQAQLPEAGEQEVDGDASAVPGHAHEGAPVAPRPNPLQNLVDLSAQIGDSLRDAAAIIGDMEADFREGPHDVKPRPDDRPWIVFLRADGEDARPAVVDALNRWAAERKVSSALGLPVSACFAIPAELASNVVAALPLEEHPRHKAEPMDLGDVLAHALEGVISKTEEKTTAIEQELADTLGISVAELRARDAKAEEKRVVEEATKAARRSPRAAPKMRPVKAGPGAAPLDASRRMLTPRQVELLALVEVDRRSNRVVYTPTSTSRTGRS